MMLWLTIVDVSDVFAVIMLLIVINLNYTDRFNITLSYKWLNASLDRMPYHTMFVEDTDRLSYLPPPG